MIQRRRLLGRAAPLCLAAVTLASCGGGPTHHSRSSGSPAKGSTSTSSTSAVTSTTLPVVTSTTAAPTTTLPVVHSTTTTTGAVGPSSVTATDGGLTFQVTAAPTHGPVTTAVVFTIVASATHATGALHYDVQYGDGTSDADAVPEYCVAAPGPAASQTWMLSHQYKAAGTYTVSITVAVNCSGQSATATMTVSPTT